MSGHNQGGRFVVAEMRRRWTLPEKKAIVAESQTTSTAISAVARKNGIAPALLFRWRRELGAALRRPAAARFVPVCLPAPVVAAAAPAVASSGVIEIELVRSGMRLRVDGQVDAAALKRVLDVLEGR